MSKFRKQVRLSAKSRDGRHALSFGMRFGYWPCLKAPFVQLAVGPYLVDLWFGLAPS